MFEILASGKPLVFEFRVTEVDEQADFDSGGFQIVDDLALAVNEPPAGNWDDMNIEANYAALLKRTLKYG